MSTNRGAGSGARSFVPSHWRGDARTVCPELEYGAVWSRGSARREREGEVLRGRAQEPITRRPPQRVKRKHQPRKYVFSRCPHDLTAVYGRAATRRSCI